MKKIIFICFFFVLFFFLKVSLIISNEINNKFKYVIGKPYKIGKIWYYPRENYSYKETGIASIYSSREISLSEFKFLNKAISKRESFLSKSS